MDTTSWGPTCLVAIRSRSLTWSARRCRPWHARFRRLCPGPVGRWWVIGGLAVVCRLSRPYRVTSDLDTVSRRGTGEAPQLQLLVASGAEVSGVSGVLVPTPAGLVQVDVLEVTDAELANLPDDPTDRLHVLSHAWAAATATPVVIRADGMPGLTVEVAEPGPLVAMKLQSVMNRGAAKEATDLLDIVQLSLDPAASPLGRAQLATADSQLQEDAARHARRWFQDHAERSVRVMRAIPRAARRNWMTSISSPNCCFALSRLSQD